MQNAATLRVRNVGSPSLSAAAPSQFGVCPIFPCGKGAFELQKFLQN